MLTAKMLSCKRKYSHITHTLVGAYVSGKILYLATLNLT